MKAIKVIDCKAINTVEEGSEKRKAPYLFLVSAERIVQILREREGECSMPFALRKNVKSSEISWFKTQIYGFSHLLVCYAHGEPRSVIFKFLP